MTWEELNKDNIEEIKDLYAEYIQENKKDTYGVLLLTFQDFIEQKLIKCTRCGKIITKEESKSKYEYEYLCECCYDDLYV